MNVTLVKLQIFNTARMIQVLVANEPLIVYGI